ncbi:serine hydrolase domain-containing protein [Streptomyces telluris]|uniref:Beta-lactamase family protein n=1 Tax=Streptomyces telluris TaxID=2720021 RepID=A0A9X2LEQ7_9ACTN|nr:serine hydrolase domain-containing protein [Streptomyces telluris]MCQ8769567.1 beta-lactamase family protein [Streptomyces telluris]NJP78148.1 beta-lactamase family protein [Streptomyces telluris]
MSQHVSKVLRATLVALTATAVVGTAVVPAVAATAPGADKAHAATQEALNGLVAADMPGVAAEARTPKGTWSGSAGYADTATKRKRTAADHFRAGSITKSFVATVLLQLEAEGKLSIDDSVEKWLPGVIKGNGYDANKITIRQLLNHTSGVHDMVYTPEWNEQMNGQGFFEHRYDIKTPEQIVAMGIKYGPDFEPGKGWRYSNTNFVLGGMIIEKATGNAYAREVERRIVKPLGLKETTFPGTDPKLPAPHPVGYSKLYVPNPGPEIYDATEYRPSWSGATGEVVSTSGDLNRFYSALLQGKLLPKKQLDAMLTTVETGEHYTYGLGIISRKLSCGVQVYGHDGVVWGSLSGSAGTRDGKHMLTFNINGDWLNESPPFENMFEGEFCGALPKPVKDKPAAAPSALNTLR